MLVAWVVPFGIAWWIFTVLATIGFLAMCFEEDFAEVGVWILLAVYLIITCVTGTWNPFAWAVGLTKMQILWRGLLYLAIGACWSFFKWYHSVSKAGKYWLKQSKTNGERYAPEYEKAAIAEKISSAGLEGEEAAKFRKDSLRFRDYENQEDLIERICPSFSNTRFSYWILWWPLSVLNFILADFVDWIVEHLFFGFYKRIRNAVLKNIGLDFAEFKDREAAVDAKAKDNATMS